VVLICVGISSGFATDYHLDEMYQHSEFRGAAIDKVSNFIDYAVDTYETVYGFWNSF